MKRLWTVFEFELFSYIKNKSFIITTALICLIIGLGMFAPRVFDMSDLLGTESLKEKEGDSGEDAKEQALGIYDESGYFKDTKLLSDVFKDADIKSYDSAKALEKAVKKEDIKAGFYVIDDLHYNYYVINRNRMKAPICLMRFYQLYINRHTALNRTLIMMNFQRNMKRR